jgi:hypothetical protein
MTTGLVSGLASPATVTVAHRTDPTAGRPHSTPTTAEPRAGTPHPAVSPRLRRRPSPWPPGRLSHRGREFPATYPATGAHRTQPYPPDLSWWAVKGRQTLIPRVHLPVSLTGPAPFGSTDLSRRCQGCSHPHRRLPGQAALSFNQPLRRPAGAGLSPPLDFRRLVAHTDLRPVLHVHHLPIIIRRVRFHPSPPVQDSADADTPVDVTVAVAGAARAIRGRHPHLQVPGWGGFRRCGRGAFVIKIASARRRLSRSPTGVVDIT